jgi:hypothetical protein
MVFQGVKLPKRGILRHSSEKSHFRRIYRLHRHGGRVKEPTEAGGKLNGAIIVNYCLRFVT